MTARPAVAAAIAALVICSSVTACEWFVPGVNLAYGGEGMHIAIGATRATVCLVVGGLAWARFARSRALLDLSIAIAFETMFVESAFFLDLPTLLHFDQVTPFSAWSSTAATLLAATVLLAGALARPCAVERQAAALVLAAGVAALAATAVLLLVYAGSLPQAVDPGVSPLTRPTRVFFGNPVVLAAQAAAAAITLTAAIRLLSSRLAGREPLLVWLAPALVIDAAASANYSLFPSLFSYWVYTGDILRLLFCIVLAGGIVLELRASVRRTIELAVAEERRRLARDLHDGVAQELAFVASEVADLPAALHPSLPWIRSAVERALYESRRAIAALTTSPEGPLDELVVAAAEDVTSRAGAALRVNVDSTVKVSPQEQEAILRVLREAATNATRHGHASTIVITIEGSGTQLARLAIRDDGSGIVNGGPAGGFGVRSMRERIEAIGGTLAVESQPGGGTVVEAVWRRTSAE